MFVPIKVLGLKIKGFVLASVIELMIYTPAIFEVFQAEYEKHLAAYTISSDGTYEFVIAIGALEGKSTIEEESRFIVTPADQIVSCSC